MKLKISRTFVKSDPHNSAHKSKWEQFGKLEFALPPQGGFEQKGVSKPSDNYLYFSGNKNFDWSSECTNLP